MYKVYKQRGVLGLRTGCQNHNYVHGQEKS